MSADAFDAREARCVKCGSDDIHVRWHGKGANHRSRRFETCREYGEERGKPVAEHLHYTCRTCGYVWTGSVAAVTDTKPASQATPASEGRASVVPDAPTKEPT